jgi:type IV secretory pathway VirB10-like protein
MFSNRVAVVALGIGCITAAAAGGFIAARQTSVPTPAVAQTAEQTPAAAPVSADASAASRPVQETEAVVGDAAKPPAAPAAAPISTAPPSPPAKSARRAEAEPPARTSRAAAAREPAAPSRQEPPPLASTWPASAAPSSTAAAPAPAENASPVRPDERTTQEVARTPEPPQKAFEELVVSADSVIGLQTETRLSSETARVEDRVEARVTRDVRVGDRIAIPAGSQAIGSVMQVDRGGKFKERARLGIRFNMLVLADGTRVPISTETIYRDGEAPGNTSAAKVGGGAVGGAILGAILGGAKGAVIGGTTGAAGGTAAVMAGNRSEVVLPPGTPMTVRVLSPVTITTEKE